MIVQKEILLLHEFDKPDSDLDEDVSNLDSILMHKVESRNYE